MKVSSSSNLFALRTLAPGAGVASVGKPIAATAESSLAEQIAARQEALPSQSAISSSPKQAALEKAAMLKRRLEMLKAMLLFASPEAAKSIASQLKGIAGELAALGKSLGGGASATIATPNAAAPTGETASVATTAEAGPDLQPTPMSAEPTDAGNEEQTSNAGDSGDVASDNSGDSLVRPGESTPESDDSALRKTIAEAKRLLRALILRVKAKLQEGDAQARRDLQAAERSLADLEHMADADLYSATGGLSTDTAGAELPLALAGACVDTSA